MDQSQSVFQHDEVTKPLTLPRQTEIRMPMLDEETDFTALFILESDVPPNVSFLHFRLGTLSSC